LVAELIEIARVSSGDPECAHARADDLLLKFIDDDDITQLFNNIDKWYA
jgi:hypothetical protein